MRQSPSLVIGEIHNPRKPVPSPNPQWLTIPERGLYTGIAIFGVPNDNASDWIAPAFREIYRVLRWNRFERNCIRPAAQRAKITKHISWHVFRHTFSTLLAENDEDVKTAQSLMRHANSNIDLHP